MLQTKEAITIEEGEHTGTISKVENRVTDEKYEYTDIHIELSDIEDDVTLKIGAPTSISRDKEGKPRSKLAIILNNLGLDITAGEVDEQSLIGNKVKFITFNKETDKGTFARIVPETLKPVK